MHSEMGTRETIPRQSLVNDPLGLHHANHRVFPISWDLQRSRQLLQPGSPLSTPAISQYG